MCIRDRIETAAVKAEVDLQKALQFLSHLAIQVTPALTQAADIAEVLTGNGELVPITNGVSGVVTQVASSVQGSNSLVHNVGTIGAAVAQAAGGTQISNAIHQVSNVVSGAEITKPS